MFYFCFLINLSASLQKKTKTSSTDELSVASSLFMLMLLWKKSSNQGAYQYRSSWCVSWELWGESGSLVVRHPLVRHELHAWPPSPQALTLSDWCPLNYDVAPWHAGLASLLHFTERLQSDERQRAAAVTHSVWIQRDQVIAAVLLPSCAAGMVNTYLNRESTKPSFIINGEVCRF